MKILLASTVALLLLAQTGFSQSIPAKQSPESQKLNGGIRYSGMYKRLDGSTVVTGFSTTCTPVKQEEKMQPKVKSTEKKQSKKR